MSKKKLIGAALAATAIGAVAVKAARFVPEKKAWAPLPDDNVNVEKYIDDLSSAIKIPTVSYFDEALVDWSRFEELHRLLEERFPLVHSKLELEIVSRASLMYRWKGKRPELEPMAMLAHQDVVPISSGTEEDWVYPPFSGEVAEGFIWGRGALDIKNHLIGVLEAVEALLAEGFEPERDVYLCFGHNEEVMADKENCGAICMMELLKSRGVRLDSVLDEGGAMLPIKVPGIIDTKLAGIGVAEKGHCDFELTIRAKGGHSSQPPVHTALGQLAAAIKDLEDNQFKAEMTPMLTEIFDRLGRKLSYPVRLLACNHKLLKPVLLEIIKQIPPVASMSRTTTAVTMASGSPAPNVLPQKASATVNFRIMPGETMEDVEAHIRKVVKNKNIEVRLLKGKDPSKISPTDSRAFNAITEITNSLDVNAVVTPYLVMGGTDARSYEPICDNIYRYSPFTMSTELLLTTHGTNERIPIDTLGDALRFFKQYIRLVSAE